MKMLTPIPVFKLMPVLYGRFWNSGGKASLTTVTRTVARSVLEFRVWSDTWTWNCFEGGQMILQREQY